jgi:hypothetical protein
MILRGTQLADRHELPVLLVQFAKLILQHGHHVWMLFHSSPIRDRRDFSCIRKPPFCLIHARSSKGGENRRSGNSELKHYTFSS